MYMDPSTGQVLEVNDGDEGMYDLSELQAGRGKQVVFSKDPILNKLARVANKQGDDIMKSQVTYQTVYDTIDLFGNPTAFNFFKTLQNKPEPLANLQVNRFEDGKAMAIETVTFKIQKWTAASAGILINIAGIEETRYHPDFLNFLGLAVGTASITISQQTSIDSLDLSQQLSAFNPASRTLSLASVTTNAASTFATLASKGYCSIHLPNPIIIAPNQAFTVDLATAAYTAVPTVGIFRLQCTLAGRGVLAKVQGTN